MMNRNTGFPPQGNHMPCHRGHASFVPPTPHSCGRSANGGCLPDSRRLPAEGSPKNGPSCPLSRNSRDSSLGHSQNRPRTVPAQNRNDGSGCGCGRGEDKCKRLLEQIRAVDFALWETVLYLDVYPHSCDALETYHKLKAQCEALRREYETACGPLTATGNHSISSWDWMSKPFPWEYDAD